MTHTVNAVKQKSLVWGMVPAVMFAAVVVTPIQSHAQDALRIAPSGNVGLGIDSPERQLHLRGSNATFRMDRSADTAAFLLVRTNTAGTPLKTFVVGANAAGPNNGEFVINDLGAAVTGGGTRRLTITNTGVVQAQSFVPTSSQRFKEDVVPLADALALTRQLQGVRFVWKDSGRPALGLIAEDVAAVLPEVVERDADGQATGVNYMALVAVLVEAVKDQQVEIAAYQTEVVKQLAELAALRSEFAGQQAHLARLEAHLSEFETVRARLAKVESLLAGGGLPVVFAQR